MESGPMRRGAGRRPGKPSREVRGLVLAALAALVALVVAGGSGCGGPEAGPGLEDARSSDEAVAGAALSALERGDRAALEGMLLTGEEHRELLWEQLPESNTWPFGYARRLTERNTRKALDRAIERWGGTSFELLGIEYTKEREEYAGFTLHRGAVLHVRRAADGEEGTMEFLDVLVERRGAWKPMNYTE